eukprot:6209437-Pleurochrysis_carterae.AAC.1
MIRVHSCNAIYLYSVPAETATRTENSTQYTIAKNGCSMLGDEFRTSTDRLAALVFRVYINICTFAHLRAFTICRGKHNSPPLAVHGPAHFAGGPGWPTSSPKSATCEFHEYNIGIYYTLDHSITSSCLCTL